MNLTAAEMDELALLCRDINAGAREQLAAEDDARVVLGKPMRVAREIGIWLVAFTLFAIGLAALPGCTKASDARERMAVMTAYAEAETADLKETPHSFSDKEPDSCVQVRAREPADPKFAEFPSTCILKLTAVNCSACGDYYPVGVQNGLTQLAEGIKPWAERSGWKVPVVVVDADGDFVPDAGCEHFNVQAYPTYIVIRGGREVARYAGADKSGFLPILKEACK